MVFAATEIKTSQAPSSPTYFLASPGSCMTFLVLNVVSATYSIDAVVKNPAMISHSINTGQPAFLAE